MPTLNWIGKDKVVNHAAAVPFHVLEHVYNFGGSSENKIIHGDNLLALKSLLPEYEGRIKCIYIDPPYNTGNEGWIYNDKVNSPQIKKWLGEVVGKEGEDLSRHDKWLCMMYPRLKLLKKLLADDGAIFISIDDNEQANLKLICDEIFGAQNFVANIAVINNLKGRSDDKFIATAHENLLIYRKENFTTNGVPIPEEYIKEYKLEDERGKYRLQGLRKRGANSRREDRPNMFYPFFYDEKTGVLSVDELPDAIEILPHLSDGADGCWRWGKNTVRERLNELTVQKVKGRGEYDVFQKDYLGERRVKPKSFWAGAEFSAEAGTLILKTIMGKSSFSTPKPVKIVEYILEQATDKDSIVLDSFAGSGTTAHAVLNLNAHDGGNRKFILIEMENYADTITAERVRRVIQGYGQTAGTDGSFDFYEVGEPLMIHDNLNENIDVEKIRAYIWYTETRSPYKKPSGNNPAYLGDFNNIAYYFHYERDRRTTLDAAFLRTIEKHADSYLIYADECGLDEDFLQRNSITFKKIPRDIKKIWSDDL